jgi:hypothetical protein
MRSYRPSQAVSNGGSARSYPAGLVSLAARSETNARPARLHFYAAAPPRINVRSCRRQSGPLERAPACLADLRSPSSRKVSPEWGHVTESCYSELRDGLAENARSAAALYASDHPVLGQWSCPDQVVLQHARRFGPRRGCGPDNLSVAALVS